MLPGTGSLPWVALLGTLAAGGSPDGAAPPDSGAAVSAEDAEEEEEEGAEAGRGWLGGLEFGLEADLELAYEDEGGDTAGEVTFDEVGFSVEGPWWQTEMGIKFRSEAGTSFLVEDAALRVGGTEAWPWFLTVGRTVLPFGEFDSPFAEDPMVTLAGETDDESLVFGYGGERLEAAAGMFRGDLAAGDGFDAVVSAALRVAEGTRVGLSWTSDLSEATEIRELYREGIEEGNTLQGEREGVPGMAGFAAVQRGRWIVYGEAVAALASLPGGFLDDERRQPAAWNLEVWFRPSPRWQIAGRVEGSHDLPRNPSRQAGLALSRALTRHLAASVEYLRGEPGPLAASRHLVSGKLSVAL